MTRKIDETRDLSVFLNETIPYTRLHISRATMETPQETLEGTKKKARQPKGKQQQPTKRTPSKHSSGGTNNQSDVFTKKQEPPFEDYWTRDRVAEGLKTGTLLQGIIRISQNDYKEAYVSDPREGPDYYVPGTWARNRALEGDIVAFEVLPPAKWELYKGADKIDKKELKIVKDEATPINAPTGDVNGETTPPEEPLQRTLIDALYAVKDVVGVANGPVPKATNLMSHDRDLRKYRRTVKVVYIISTGHSRACAGSVKIYNKGLQLALFSPRDSRVPRAVIKLSDLPPDYCQSHSKYEKTLFVCRILEWKPDNPFPFGQLLRSLGEAGEIEPETDSILSEYEIDDQDFPQEVLDSLPSSPDGSLWTIPEEEILKRRDFRSDLVVTIDPATARDLDDAVHCKLISPGVYELGVHIADVSYFLRPGTALDRIASERATSVYLIQKVIPMLPRRLCEDLCSLNPHEDRLTFSVVWKLTIKGELLDEWMGRSIICSRGKLSYDDAQRMIDDPSFPWQHSDFPCIADAESVPLVVKSVTTLNKITKQLRFLRQARGTLRLDQPKLVFGLDKTSGLPNGCHIYQHKESNKLIEECMLLANMAVAHRIEESFPDLALLRRHPSPKERSLDIIREQFRSIGVAFDFSSSGDLQQSLNRYTSKRTAASEEEILMERQVLISLCCRAMELALYFCTGSTDEDKYHHYALNVPRYTHFTSPIRRYADVIVHRLLAAALGQGTEPMALLTDDVEEQANQCNKKRKNAKIAEELSSNLFLGVFVRECGPLTQSGMVTGVLDKSFDVLIPELGIVKRVYCEKLSLAEFKYELRGDNVNEPHLLLVWKAEKDREPLVQDISVFSSVEVILSSVKNSLHFEAVISPGESKQ